MTDKKFKDSIIILAITFILATWIMVNTDFKVGSIYAMLTIGSIVMYSIFSVNKIKNIINIKYDTSLMIGFLGAVGYSIFILASPNLAISIPTPVYSFEGVQNFMYVVVLASIVEEFMFRGWLLALLRNFMNTNYAVILSSLAFTGYHASVYGVSMTMSFIGAFVFGLFASYLTITTNNLTSGILLHSLNNAIQFMRNNSLFAII